MPKSFIVTPLRPEHIDQALPVVQALRPAITAAEWRSMARDFARAGAADTSADSGIIACRTSSGHIRGLFCYTVTTDNDERRLAVGPFVVAGLFDTGATASGLMEAIEQLATRLDAQAVDIDTATCRAAATASRPCLIDMFLAGGYRLTGRTLRRVRTACGQDHPAGHA